MRKEIPISNDLKSEVGLPGQNAETPSMKIFTNHQIIKYGSTYYDPSYGVTYTGADDFEAKVMYGFVVGPFQEGEVIYYRASNGSGEDEKIIFEEIAPPGP